MVAALPMAALLLAPASASAATAQVPIAPSPAAAVPAAPEPTAPSPAAAVPAAPEPVAPVPGASAPTAPVPLAAQAAVPAVPTAAQPAAVPVLRADTTWTVERSRDGGDDRGREQTLREGDRVRATVRVTNATDSPVVDLTIAGVGDGAVCDQPTLLAGATTTCRTAARTVDHVDAAIGTVDLASRAEAFTPTGLLVRAPATPYAARTAPGPTSGDPLGALVALVAATALAVGATLLGGRAMALTDRRRHPRRPGAQSRTRVGTRTGARPSTLATR